MHSKVRGYQQVTTRRDLYRAAGVAALVACAAALARIALASSGVIVTRAVLKAATGVDDEAGLEPAAAGGVTAGGGGAPLAPESLAAAGVAEAALAGDDAAAGGGGGGALDDVELEEEEAGGAEPVEPVRDNAASWSGMVSMNAMVGPAMRVFVSWSTMLVDNG